MRPASEKKEVQAAKYPSMQQQREEKKRKFHEMHKQTHPAWSSG